jgi:hypothetical protein
MTTKIVDFEIKCLREADVECESQFDDNLCIQLDQITKSEVFEKNLP